MQGSEPHQILTSLNQIFEQGKTYVVFLDKEVAPKPGGCSYNNPVGLDAGAFVEEMGVDGTMMLRNGFNNRELFDRSTKEKLSSKSSLSLPEKRVLEHQSGPIEKQSFLSLVKKMAQ